MNFFEHQDQARKQTRVLLFLFLLAVLAVIVLANILLVFLPIDLPVATESGRMQLPIWVCISSEECVLSEHIPWPKILVISSLVILIILGGSAYKAFTLAKSGGVKVATLLGGEALDIDSKNLADKRLFNVVQEMSLAANMPPPSIFVLREEQGLNAFAAGFTNKDAVVAVTQGLLDALDREQLQAVIAHEFSHIVHGDSSLNMRLLSIVHGLLCISELGFIILRSCRFGRRRYGSNRRTVSYGSSRGKNGQAQFAFLAVGLALVVVGYIGVFFGNLIKSAISRQREFLADASAVKYTRQPDAVADALKIILSKGAQSRGSYLETEHAGEMSHFFFSKSINQLQSVFATHPKLVDRIFRVQPNWDGDTTTKSHISDVRRKAREHAAAEKVAQKQAQKNDIQFNFDLEASPLVAALMAVDLAEEEGLLNLDDPVPAKSATEGNAEIATQLTLQQVLAELKPLLSTPVSAVCIILELLSTLQFSTAEKDDNAELNSDVLKNKQALRDIAIKHWPTLAKEWKKLDALDSLCQVQDESLKIVELCLPALRQLRQDEFQLLKKLLVHFIKSDGKIEVLEWCIHRFIIEHLESHFSFKKPAAAKYQHADQVQTSVLVLLHLFIGSSDQSDLEKNKAYAKACDALGFYQNSGESPDWSNLPSLAEFGKATTQLQSAYSLLKGKLINVCKTAALHDGTIEAVERQVLLILAVSWDIPMPDLMFDAMH